jgi:hypothetical protein
MKEAEKQRRREARRNKKSKAKKGPIRPAIDGNAVQFFIGQLEKNHPPFVQASILMLLCSVMKHVDPTLGGRIAATVIAGSKSPLVVYTASKLLLSCAEDVACDLLPILPKLLEAAPIFCDPVIPKVIVKICELNSGELGSYAFEVMGSLLDAVHGQLVDEQTVDRAGGSTDSLDALYDIVAEMPDDSPALIAMCDTYLLRILWFFEEFPENDSFTNILNLISAFTQKVTDARPVELEMLSGLVQLAVNDSAILTCGKQLTLIVYPIVASKNRIIFNDEKLAQGVCQLCEAMIATGFDRDLSPVEDLAYSLFLGSVMIQVFGATTIKTFVPLAVEWLNQSMEQFAKNEVEEDVDWPMCFSAACHVIAAGFALDLGTTVQNMRPEVMHFIVGQISKRTMPRYREMKIAFLILINITRLGEMSGYEKAASLFKKLLKLKRDEEASDDSDDDQEENDENEEEADIEVHEEEDECEEESESDALVLDTPCYIPLDDFDAVSLFVNVTSELGLFDRLDPEVQDLVQQAVSNM